MLIYLLRVHTTDTSSMSPKRVVKSHYVKLNHSMTISIRNIDWRIHISDQKLSQIFYDSRVFRYSYLWNQSKETYETYDVDAVEDMIRILLQPSLPEILIFSLCRIFCLFLSVIWLSPCSCPVRVLFVSLLSRQERLLNSLQTRNPIDLRIVVHHDWIGGSIAMLD